MVKTAANPINIDGIRTLYPFASHYHDIHGFKYHYIDEGNGDPVIMVHGNPTWSFFFRELIKGLSGKYRTIAVDHIGCGLSEKPDPGRYPYDLKRRIDDFELFIEKMGLKTKLTLIVHDWGGMIGMAYALRHRHHIGRLVIMNTAAFLPPHQKKIPWQLQIIRRIRPFAAPAVLGLNVFARGALVMAPNKKLPKPVRQGLLAPYNCRENRIATLKFVQDIPLKKGDHSYDTVKKTDDRLHLLADIPMIILWGKKDFVFDMDYYSEWRRRFPLSEAHVFEKAGHYLLEDAPEEILDRIMTFFSKHPINTLC